MAVSTADIKSDYPLPVYNYRVTVLIGGAINKLIEDIPDRTAVISCSEVSGLNSEIEPITYKDGFSFMIGPTIIPGQTKEVNISIKKGVTANSSYFSDWMKMVYPNVISNPIHVLRKRDLLIDLCDETGQAIVRWKVLKAMPTKLDAPTFDVNTNEVAYEQIDFIAHHLKVEYLTKS